MSNNASINDPFTNSINQEQTFTNLYNSLYALGMPRGEGNSVPVNTFTSPINFYGTTSSFLGNMQGGLPSVSSYGSVTIDYRLIGVSTLTPEIQAGILPPGDTTPDTLIHPMKRYNYGTQTSLFSSINFTSKQVNGKFNTEESGTIDLTPQNLAILGVTVPSINDLMGGFLTSLNQMPSKQLPTSFQQFISMYNTYVQNRITSQVYAALNLQVTMEYGQSTGTSGVEINQKNFGGHPPRIFYVNTFNNILTDINFLVSRGVTPGAGNVAINVIPTIKTSSGTSLGVNQDNVLNGIANDMNKYGGINFMQESDAAAGESAIGPPTVTAGQAELWFNQVLAQFAAQDAPRDIVKELTKQLGFTVSMATPTIGGHAALNVPGNAMPELDQSALMNYQSVFNALFPNGIPNGQGPNGANENYQQYIQDYIKQQTINLGFFLPSPSFSTYVSQLQKQYINLVPSDFTSLSSIGARKAAVLNSIYALIALMLQSMQSVTAAQATRLTILTQWQQAYSRLQSQLPVFLTDKFGFLGSSIISELNTVLNQSLASNMQTRQSLVGDDAKALQSNINQSNDAVSQQANMGTSIIQELSSILSAIFR